MFAADGRHVDCAEALLLAGASIDLSNEDGDTTGVLAQRHPGLVQLLDDTRRHVSEAAVAASRERERHRAAADTLAQAINAFSGDSIREVQLDRLCAALNAVEATHAEVSTAFEQALKLASSRNTAAMQMLISARANVHHREPPDGPTALMEACAAGFPQAMALLLEAQANVDVRDEQEPAESSWRHLRPSM